MALVGKPVGYSLIDQAASGKIDDVDAYYKNWSNNYEKDLNKISYNPWEAVVSTMQTLLPDKKDAKILDIGAGTGKLGQKAAEAGFTNLDALDPNAGMLAEAKKKGIYGRVIEAYLGMDRLDIEDDTYDAIIGSALFVPDHADDKCFEELIRVVKPGGYICWSMMAHYLDTSSQFKDCFEPKIKLLCAEKRWQQLKREDIPNYYQNDTGLLWLFKVL